MKFVEEHKIGALKLYCVVEESGEGSIEVLLNPPSNVLEQCTTNGFFSRAVRAYLLNDNGNWSLFDAGFGRHIFEAMDYLNVSPLAITHVYLTHLHPDHIGGMLIGEELMFPNANVFLSHNEYDYWMSDISKQQVSIQKQSYFDVARKVLKAYKNNLCLQEPISFDDLPSENHEISMIEAYGHTPGHVMYFIRQDENSLLLCGDLIHALDVQVLHPEISVVYDVDPIQAMKTRTSTFEYVANSNILVAGVHVAYSGVIAIKKGTTEYSYLIVK